ncbi:MAG: GNAT family N-acetyltransferase [Anaerolineae bacterium]|nr:GNAT family N-acetyltransferase [Anaerolineae bacterium]
MLTLPLLETERLTLRRFELNDANLITELLQNAEVTCKLIDIPRPYTQDHAENMIRESHKEALAGSAYRFCIERKSDELVIGYADVEINSQHQRGEIAYWLGQPYWWQGYATEAVRILVEFCFKTLELNRVYAYCLASNTSSARVLEKAGLEREGIHRQNVLLDGVFEDVIFYGLLREFYHP